VVVGSFGGEEFVDAEQIHGLDHLVINFLFRFLELWKVAFLTVAIDWRFVVDAELAH
jgi:hypothetical protein